MAGMKCQKLINKVIFINKITYKIGLKQINKIKII